MAHGIPANLALLLIVLVALIVAGCAGNEPYRMEDLPNSAKGCDGATIEKHKNPEHNETYDLAFVEFTERGNVFDRAKLDMVLEHVEKQAATKPGECQKGIIVIVFVHGWKHSASLDDENVVDFRNLLRKTARLAARKCQAQGQAKPSLERQMICVYVGWRGASITLPLIKELTYWDRKSVAEQVGKGGVTELLTRLEQIVIDKQNPNRNLYLVVGHSLGGAIVLAALNEVLLERVVAAEPVPDSAEGCVVSRPFGHGVVLLNSAMEANEVFQLKEVVSRIKCFPWYQDRLMHVITSDADTATGAWFKAGQWLGMLSWKEAQLVRSDKKEFGVHESDIDTTTVGHYLPFQTGQLCGKNSERPECKKDSHLKDCFRDSPDRSYISYAGHEECVYAENRPNHIKVAKHEPLAFVQTDSEFIKDHNYVFTDSVAGYLAAIVAEARYKRGKTSGSRWEGVSLPECEATQWNFARCLAAINAEVLDKRVKVSGSKWDDVILPECETRQWNFGRCLAAINAEALDRLAKISGSKWDDVILPGCEAIQWNFGTCLHAYIAAFEQIKLD